MAASLSRGRWVKMSWGGISTTGTASWVCHSCSCGASPYLLDSDNHWQEERFMSAHKWEESALRGGAYLWNHMMTSSNRNIFCITGPLCGEFPGDRWIPLTKASDAELWCFVWSVPWIKGWVNNHETGDLRRHYAHYDVTVITFCITVSLWGESTSHRWIPSQRDTNAELFCWLEYIVVQTIQLLVIWDALMH